METPLISVALKVWRWLKRFELPLIVMAAGAALSVSSAVAGKPQRKPVEKLFLLITECPESRAS